MTIFTRRFSRRTESARPSPPGQCPTPDFQARLVRSTSRIDPDDWRFTFRNQLGAHHGWTGPQRGDLDLPMGQILRWAIVFLASWGVGLLVAAWVVPGVLVSLPGFVVGVLAFAVMQGSLSVSILKLPREYASLLLGGTGLAWTIVALILASTLTHGLSIDGMPSWLAATAVVWLVTTIGAITIPELLIRGST